MAVRSAIGFVETRGLVGVIEAADVAAKATDVRILGFQQTGGGLVCVRLAGDVAAVQTAVLTAVEAAGRICTVISHSVLPAPHAALTAWLADSTSGSIAPGSVPKTPRGPAAREMERPLEAGSDPGDLEQLSVAHLRGLVRQMPETRLKGRQVSRANKAALIAELRRLRSGRD